MEALEKGTTQDRNVTGLPVTHTKAYMRCEARSCVFVYMIGETQQASVSRRDKRWLGGKQVKGRKKK